MATTTTNYGFDVPTSSDLVKNGATAISTLGQDIDTFLFRPFSRNGSLNSSFNVWQRGTSISVAGASNGYTADRWQLYTQANQASTVSRQATNDTTNLPNIQYCARVQRNSGQTGTGQMSFIQGFETLNSVPYAGKQVTLSYYARAGANFSPTSSTFNFMIYTGTGTDQNPTGYTGGATVAVSTVNLTTTWVRYTVTGTVATTATEISLYAYWSATGTAGANDYVEITGVQLEVGNQASPYAPATPTYQAELEACQRYYYLHASGTNQPIANGNNNSATLLRAIISFPVTMRVAPSLVASSGTNYYLYQCFAAADTFNSLTLGDVSTNGMSVFNNTEILGVGGQGGVVITNNASASVAFSAEL